MPTIETIFRDAADRGQLAVINGAFVCPNVVLEALQGKGVLSHGVEASGSDFLLPGGLTVRFVTPLFLRLPDDHPHRQKTILRSTLVAIAAADPEQHVVRFMGEWLLLCVVAEGVLLQTGDHYLFRRAETFDAHCRMVRGMQEDEEGGDGAAVLPVFHGIDGWLTRRSVN